VGAISFLAIIHNVYYTCIHIRNTRCIHVYTACIYTCYVCTADTNNLIKSNFNHISAICRFIARRHTFCRSCIEQALEQQQQCPMDRRSLDMDTTGKEDRLVPASYILQNLVDELMVECELCGHCCQRSRYPSHHATECQEALIQCRQCQQLMKRRQKQEHACDERETNVCFLITVPCPSILLQLCI
jgi:hypothetical protein